MPESRRGFEKKLIVIVNVVVTQYQSAVFLLRDYFIGVEY